MQLIYDSDQQVQMELSHPMLSSTIMLSFVYGSYDGRERRSLWQELATANITAPWMGWVISMW